MNKLILLIPFLWTIGCITPSNTIKNELVCSWNDQYRLCLCYVTYGHSLAMTLAPNEICNRDLEKENK